MKQYLLFDLDGTLTDPKVGITTCVQYALHSLGIEEPDLDKLEPFIGPPLKESFRQFYHLNEEQVEEAVKKYRERFQDVGLFENELYKGIPEMLRTLQSKGVFLAVASSKPTVFVQRILEHFQIAKYFKVVVGSELDGTRVEKEEVVKEALSQLFGDKPIQYDKVYMIGDRKFDIEGARAIGVESVGVAYGYGSMEELKAAKADYIVRDVEELQKFLLRGSEDNTAEAQAKRPKGFFQTVWVMLFPFLMFVLVRQLVSYMLSLGLIATGSKMSGGLADFLVVKNAAGELTGFTGNASTIMSALAFAAGAAVIWKTAKAYMDRTAEEMKLSHLKREPMKNYVILLFTTIAATLGMNLLLELSGVTNKSEIYQEVVKDQYSAVFFVGIICYGMITPLAEEILFRGVIFNCLKRMTGGLQMAILISALLFGLYHGNYVQGVYAFVMGCLMAYAYEYFGSFYAPVMIHMVSNMFSYTLSSTALVSTAFVSWPMCLLFLALTGVGLRMLMKQKKLF